MFKKFLKIWRQDTVKIGEAKAIIASIKDSIDNLPQEEKDDSPALQKIAGEVEYLYKEVLK